MSIRDICHIYVSYCTVKSVVWSIIYLVSTSYRQMRKRYRVKYMYKNMIGVLLFLILERISGRKVGEK